MGADASTFYSQVVSQLGDAATNLVPSQYSEVVEGYKAIYNITANTLLTPVGQAEILLSLTSAGTIAIQAALQHPFSHGRLYINSSNAFDYPVIDPGYLSHSAGKVALNSRLLR